MCPTENRPAVIVAAPRTRHHPRSTMERPNRPLPTKSQCWHRPWRMPNRLRRLFAAFATDSWNCDKTKRKPRTVELHPIPTILWDCIHRTIVLWSDTIPQLRLSRPQPCERLWHSILAKKRRTLPATVVKQVECFSTTVVRNVRRPLPTTLDLK